MKKKWVSMALSWTLVLGLFAQANGTVAYATGADSTTEDASVEGEVLKDVFGEVTFYRWERIKRDNYPTDSEWHLSMLVWGDSKGKKDVGYISAVAPEAIYQGPEASALEGVTHRFSKSDPVYKKTFKDSTHVQEAKSFYVRVEDRAKDLLNNSDPQVLPSKDVFYTDSDRHCVYVKYGSRDKGNKGLDGTAVPQYMIKLNTAGTSNRDYIMEPWGEQDNSAIDFRSNEYKAEWGFRSESGDRGDVWEIAYNKDDYDDPHLSIRSGFVHARGTTDEEDFCKWFIGTKLRYSSIKGDVTVGNGQILSISASDYLDADGNGESQSGVIVPSGVTITVEKGGILSVSGDLINNGTIVNNGGTILVQNGGTIYPFLQGASVEQGCGAIKCISGDMIIEKGGAVYAGLNRAASREPAAFWLADSSTIVNYGLLVYGIMKVGDGTVIENRSGGRIYGALFEPNLRTFNDMLRDNNEKLMKGNTSKLTALSYIGQKKTTTTTTKTVEITIFGLKIPVPIITDSSDESLGSIEPEYGGIVVAGRIRRNPIIYRTKGQEGYINDPFMSAYTAITWETLEL